MGHQMETIIPYHKPFITGQEVDNIQKVIESGRLLGDGKFTKNCESWFENQTSCHKAILTHTCTAALETAAILFNIQPGDEIIMPSFTFVSTANAFVLRGGIPVFVDIREDTLNVDETKIEPAITPKTRAIAVVHYAGVSCEMDAIMDIARKHKLKVVEDAAQGISARYRGRVLGSIGDLGTYSFHETKNIISGEGGCLLVNDPELASAAEVICEKGTDRAKFLRGEASCYSWTGLGSSFISSEITAAFLWAQLERADEILEKRLKIWNSYHEKLEGLEKDGMLRRPKIPDGCEHNAHLYYLILSPMYDATKVIAVCQEQGIRLTSHYAPLHTSPAGMEYSRASAALPVTEHVAKQLIRLPLWVGLVEVDQLRIIAVLNNALALSVKVDA